MDRQHLVLVARRNAYNRGSYLLLVSLGLFLAWCKWFRPSAAECVGIPPRLRRFIAKTPTQSEDTGPGARLRDAGTGRSPEPALAPLGTAAPATEPLSVDLGPLEGILRYEGRRPDSAIPILQAIQARYRYLPEAVLARVCAASEITPAQIAGVATFYSQFRQSPVGEHIVKTCEGTACHVSGAGEVSGELRRCLGIAPGSDTDPSGLFTIERVACIGSCSLAPLITIDEKIYGKLSALSAGKVLREFMEAEHARKHNGNGNGMKKHSPVP